MAEVIHWHLAPFRKQGLQHRAVPVELYEREEEPPGVYQYVRSKIVGDHGDLTDVLAYAVWDFHSFVSKATRDYLLLHAAAAARDGRVLLLPAAPDAGKSTTVAALLRAGYSYLSDELGAVDPVTAQVYPFPKRISLDQSSLEFFPGLEVRLEDRREIPLSAANRFVRPEDLDATVADPGPVSWIVFLGADRAGPPRLEPIASAAAVAELARNAFNVHVYGGAGVLLLSRLAREATSYVLHGGSPGERAELLAERLR